MTGGDPPADGALGDRWLQPIRLFNPFDPVPIFI